MDTQEPHFFVAIYTGRTISSAKIIAAPTDAELVTFAAQRMLAEQERRTDLDSVVNALEQGHLRALRLIPGHKEAEPK